MKLTVFNGSPRGKKSNTRILMEQFTAGFEETTGNTHEVHYLSHYQEQRTFRAAFEEAEAVILAFPLYTDAMPGIVKMFIETLEPLCGCPNNPAIGFLVQSGFPEAEHSRRVEKYLEKLATRLGCRYLGTMVRGGVEGIQIQPPNMTRKLFARMQAIGRSFGQTGSLDPVLVKKFAGLERIPPLAAPFVGWLGKLGLFNFYWDMQLKQNQVYGQRFARPHQKEGGRE